MSIITARKPKNSKDLIRSIPINEIFPSPENAQLYRPVDCTDPEVKTLAASIREHGIQELLVVTPDGFIISGHRRHAAAKLAGLKKVPCRVSAIQRRINGNGKINPQFIVALREFNRQRIKTFDEKLREEVVSADPAAAYKSLIEHRQNQSSS